MVSGGGFGSEVFLCGLVVELKKSSTFAFGNGVGYCFCDAEIAQLVEHNLAKVGVASSSLVFRSKRRMTVVPMSSVFSLVELFGPRWWNR